MNFHDKIHELIKALKETNEYKTFLSLKEEIKKDDVTYEKLKKFKTKQQEHHMKYLEGKEIPENELQQMQDLYAELTKNEACRQLLESEIRINVLLADMQKIIANGIKDIAEF
ncbi:MAG: YlbF family regulator [Clostridia bacterium]|nr:YlbF family regulator [Clostridia bacterium]